MIKPKKTKSGKWTAQVYLYTDENGKKIHPRVTANSKDELLLKIGMLKKMRAIRKPDERTLRDVIDQYISMSDFLSPTTIASYRKIERYAFASIMDTPVEELTDEVMQTAVNLEAKRKSVQRGTPISSKTVINEYGLISSALRAVCNKSYRVKLPKLQHRNEDLPEPSQILGAIVGTDIELPCLMAMWMSMSMSEIKGVKCSSIKGNVLSIDRVMVDVNGEEIVKETAKVDSRIRKIKLPDYVMALIEKSEPYLKYTNTGEDGFLIPLTRNQLHHRYARKMEKAGLDISFHDLRHVFASVMLTKLQIPEKIVQAEGGWTSDHIMKRVYSQTFSESRNEADALRDEYFLREISH